jgi:hypothetical protein
VQWDDAKDLYQNGDQDDPATAEEAEAYVRDCFRKWHAAHKPADPVWNASNAARFQRASVRYQQSFAAHTHKGTSSAHTAAYNATLKDFPLPGAAGYCGAVPGIPGGFELLNKAHGAAIGVHRQIYKGISCKKEGGQWSPAESITISGGYKDDEDNGSSIWYTGDGGQDGKRVQVYNQRLKPWKALAGNVGIALNCEGDIPIRVVRKKEGAVQDSYVYDGLYRVVEWKRVVTEAGPVVMKYRMERLATETSTVTAAVAFKAKNKWRGHQLARSSVNGHGRESLAAQRRRRAAVLQSPHLVSADISGGKEGQYRVCCFNDVSSEKLPEGFEYLNRSVPVGKAAELLQDFEAEADAIQAKAEEAKAEEAAKAEAKAAAKAEAKAGGTAEAAAEAEGGAEEGVVGEEPDAQAPLAASADATNAVDPAKVPADQSAPAAGGGSDMAAGSTGAAGGEAVVAPQSACMKLNEDPHGGGPWFPYNTDRCLIEVCDKLHECGAECKDGRHCMLKLVQHGLPRDLEVFMTPDNRGWGVRCWHDIMAGDFISEYVGEILTSEEADLRENDEYFFDLQVVPVTERGAEGAISQGKSEFIIDGRARGNLTRFINHSCSPSLIVQCIFVGKQRLPRICLFAWKDIQAGTELSYDYAQEHSGQNAFVCRCGAEGCKGKPSPAVGAGDGGCLPMDVAGEAPAATTAGE